MKPPPRLLTMTVRALGVLLPWVAAQLAWRLFWNLGTPAPVRAADREVHERAERSILSVSGKRVVIYTWGDGPEPILLVHGWRGRASAFATIVRALERSDRTIIAFDAPGNGDSGGRRTTLFEYAEVIEQLAARFGRFELILAHSFGVLAAFFAVRGGVTTNRIAGIAGTHSFDVIVATFCRAIRLPSRAEALLRQRIERELLGDVPGTWRAMTAELDPADITTPLLLIHDDDDPAVPVSEAHLIAEAHNGPIEVLITHGLGHSRILGDPHVVGAVEEFAGSRQPRQSRTN